MAGEPKLFEMTWEEVESAAAERQVIISWEGYLLSSKDRHFEPKKAREMYLNTLTYAFQKGRVIPEKVMQAEPSLFARLTGSPLPAPATPSPAPVEAETPIDPVAPVEDLQPANAELMADEWPDSVEKEARSANDEWQDDAAEPGQGELFTPESAAARHLAWLNS